MVRRWPALRTDRMHRRSIHEIGPSQNDVNPGIFMCPAFRSRPRQEALHHAARDYNAETFRVPLLGETSSHRSGSAPGAVVACGKRCSLHFPAARRISSPNTTCAASRGEVPRPCAKQDACRWSTRCSAHKICVLIQEVGIGTTFQKGRRQVIHAGRGTCQEYPDGFSTTNSLPVAGGFSAIGTWPRVDGRTRRFL